MCVRERDRMSKRKKMKMMSGVAESQRITTPKHTKILFIVAFNNLLLSSVCSFVVDDDDDETTL